MILWSAPNAGHGVYPGEAPFFSPSRAPIIPRSRQPEQIAQAAQQALQAVGQYMKQRHTDQLANSLLAAQNAPDYLQGQGQQGLSAYNQLQANQSESTKEYYDQAYKQAQIEHLGRLGYDTGGSGDGGVPRYPVTLPDGSTVMVTGNAAANMARGGGKATGATRAVQQMSNYGLTPEDLNLANINAQKSDLTKNQAGATASYTIATKDGRVQTIPAALWQAWTNIKKGGGFNQPQSTTAGRVTNQGDIDQATSAMQQPDLPAPDYSQSISGAQTTAPVADAFAKARAAIAAGADPDAVKKRLADAGYDTTNL